MLRDPELTGVFVDTALQGVYASRGMLGGGGRINLAKDRDSGTGQEAWLAFTAVATGTHFIEVRSSGGFAGTYTVAVAEQGDAPVSCAIIGTTLIVDDDDAGLSLGDTPVTVVEGASGTFTVALDTQPTAAVTVDVSSNDTAAATVSPARLTFTTANWDTAQTGTVTGVDDADSTDGSVTVTLDAASTGDTNYNTLGDVTVDVTVVDDDDPGLDLAGTPVEIDEGASGTFTVALDTQPTAAVTVDVTSGDEASATVSPDRLTFTTTNGGTAQTVTVSGVDDDVDGANGTAVITLDAASTDVGYNALDDVTVDVTVADDDHAGLNLTDTPVQVDENGSKTFTVALATAPTATVTVDVTSNDTAAATVSPARLTFTTANWDTAQEVTVTGAGDDDATNESVTVTLNAASTGDTDYNALADVTVNVTVVDDGLSLAGTPVEIDEDAFDTFTVALDTQPTATVTVGVTSNDTTAATVSPARLTFTTSNWNTAQTVTVTGVDDADTTDDTLTVTLDAASTDTDYNALGDVTVNVTVADDGLSLAGTPGSVDEDATDTFTVALDTQPTATVTVDVSSSDPAAASVSPARLTFTTTNWDTAQTVTVTGVDDADSADETVTVTLEVMSSDTVYGALADHTVNVTVIDDEMTRVTVSNTNLALSEDGDATYEMQLDAPPTTDVEVRITRAGRGVTVSPTKLTFTANDWSTAKTVTVTGIDDKDADNQLVTLSHRVLGGEYSGVDVDDVAATVTDDDTRSVSIDTTTADRSLAVAEGDTATYTITFGARPLSDVTITVSADSPAVLLSPASLIFTDYNWDTPQTVTVTGAPDPDADDATATLTHTATGDGYETVTIDSVTVSVTDNDTPGISVLTAAIQVAEGGSTAYPVVLDTLPEGTVTVTPSVTGNGDVTLAHHRADLRHVELERRAACDGVCGGRYGYDDRHRNHQSPGVRLRVSDRARYFSHRPRRRDGWHHGLSRTARNRRRPNGHLHSGARLSSVGHGHRDAYGVRRKRCRTRRRLAYFHDGGLEHASGGRGHSTRRC